MRTPRSVPALAVLLALGMSNALACGESCEDYDPVCAVENAPLEPIFIVSHLHSEWVVGQSGDTLVACSVSLRIGSLFGAPGDSGVVLGGRYRRYPSTHPWRILTADDLDSLFGGRSFGREASLQGELTLVPEPGPYRAEVEVDLKMPTGVEVEWEAVDCPTPP